MPRYGHACRRSHVVRFHVIHGARSARRHRLLLPVSRGKRRWCLAAAHARPLIRPEDAWRRDAIQGHAADNRLHGRQLGRADRLPIPRRRRERRRSRTAADTRRDRSHGDNQDSTRGRLAVEVAAAVDKLKDATTLTQSTNGRAAVQRSGVRTDGGGPSALNTRQSFCNMPTVTFSFRFDTRH